MSEAPHGLPGHGQVTIMRAMAQHWWAFALRGAAAILFGVLTFLSPGISIFVLLAFIAAWLAIEGGTTIWQAMAGTGPHGIWTWVDGLLSLAAAVALLVAPGPSMFAFVLMAGGFAIAVGVARIVLAFRVSDVLLGVLGAVTVLFGAMLLAQPGPGLIAIAWIIALEAIVMGAVLLALGFRLRRLRHHD